MLKIDRARFLGRNVDSDLTEAPQTLWPGVVVIEHLSRGRMAARLHHGHAGAPDEALKQPPELLVNKVPSGPCHRGNKSEFISKGRHITAQPVFVDPAAPFFTRGLKIK